MIIAVVMTPFYLLIRRPFKRSGKREAALAVFVLFTMALLVLAFEGDYGRPFVMVRNAGQRIRSGKEIKGIGGICKMTMDETIKRINELYHKSQAEDLTEEEKEEQKSLRQKYIDSIKGNLRGQLESLSIQRPDGTIEKVKKVK